MRVVLVDRLLEPGDAIGLHQFAELQRPVEREKIVGVDHQLDFLSYLFPHRAHTLGIDIWVFGVDGYDHLEPVFSLSDKLSGHLDELFLGVLLEPEGNVRRHRILRSAEQPPHRFLVIFTLDVPERDIDSAYRRAPHSRLRARVERLV